MSSNDERLKRLKDIVSLVEHPPFNFIVKEYKGSPYLQIEFTAKCAVSGQLEKQYCRKWTLQYAMTNTEVVRTAYKAAEAAVLHEFQEQFKYKGVAVFNPHIDVESQMVAAQSEPDIR